MHKITRRIEIDAGHRVPTHGSKCRNFHGHRYIIEATCTAHELIGKGEQQDMVLDYGFLKAIMTEEVHDPADHGMILWHKDPLLKLFVASSKWRETWDKCMDMDVDSSPTRCVFLGGDGGDTQSKLLIVPFIPTGERLAEFWYHCLEPHIRARSVGHSQLHSVRVWETPNCTAIYPGDR